MLHIEEYYFSLGKSSGIIRTDRKAAGTRVTARGYRDSRKRHLLKEGLCMNVLIIGGVAAGTKAAAKLLREDRNLNVTILTKSRDISYAGCGLPYYVGGLIEDRGELIVNTPQSFSRLTGAKVRTGIEVTALDRTAKTVTAKNLDDGSTETLSYDKLVITTGAEPFKPNLPGIDLPGVFCMRTPDDATGLRDQIEAGTLKRAVVVGGGFIGLEVAENLSAQGVRVTVVEMAPHILPMFDSEIAEYLENHLADQGIMTFTGDRVEEILGGGKVEKVKTSRRAFKADAVIMAAGIRPATGFLKDTGIELMPNGTVKVDAQMRTNDPDIYAAGDCVTVTNRITGQPAWSPMGSSANIEGRLLARHMTGSDVSYPGVLGTGVIRLPAINAGRTGLTEAEATAAGFDAVSVLAAVDDKAHYYPDASSFIIKLVADRQSRRLLGLQVLGKGAVDKVVDIAVMAISMNATLDQLENLDLAYAPPFSTAIHPFSNAVNVLQNKLSGALESMTPAQYLAGEAEGYTVLDFCKAPLITGAEYLAPGDINGPLEGHPLDEKLLLVCNRGRRAYMAQNRLKFYGYRNTRVLEGGMAFNQVTV